jgi:tRNA(fMet)-specific endonuclease VapC
VIPIVLSGAQFFGAFKASLQAEGKLIADADLWIGSIARSLRATVVTGNAKHLGRIPGLICENWMNG